MRARGRIRPLRRRRHGRTHVEDEFPQFHFGGARNCKEQFGRIEFLNHGSAYAHVEQDSGDEQARPKAHAFAPLSPEDLGPTREHEPASLWQLDRLHDLARRYAKYL